MHHGDLITSIKLLQQFSLCPVARCNNKQTTHVNKTTNGLSVFASLALRVIRIHADSIVRSFVEDNIVATS